jgi:hypothetical protein
MRVHLDVIKQFLVTKMPLTCTVEWYIKNTTRSFCLMSRLPRSCALNAFLAMREVSH